MELYLKQHVFTFKDRFSVYDAAGNDIYYVEGELFSWGKKLHLLDLTGREIASIEQKLFSFLPTYNIYNHQLGEAITIRQLFSFFKKYYEVSNLWSIEGDFFDHDYAIWNGSRNVASISKQWMTWGDAYEISVFDDGDIINALSVALAIDASRDNN